MSIEDTLRAQLAAQNARELATGRNLHKLAKAARAMLEDDSLAAREAVEEILDSLPLEIPF